MNTRNNQLMAFLTVEDLYGVAEIVVFPNTYMRHSNILQNDNIILINGKISVREDESTKILAEDIQTLKKQKTIVIELVTEDLSDELKQRLSSMLEFFKGERGNCSIIVGENTQITNILMSKELLEEFRELIGKDNVKMYEKE